MQIRTGSIDFSAPLRGSGPRVASQTVVFPRSVVTAQAGLGGYTVAFSGDDHHVGKIDVRLDSTVNANTVTVEAHLGLRDWSGNWDDDYEGTIDYVLLADLESATKTPPRPDLIVTGMELNQAVQFFRASGYLDPAHVQPDNAIWLVARKNTGIRVYSDWDPDAGLSPITQLTGSLSVQTSSTTLTLNPVNPGGFITPRRDAQINMAVADHTLNFMIPAAWCAGAVTVSCELWDVASPWLKSAGFTRTITFTPVQPLTIYLVGINYQAVAPGISAPLQSAIASTVVSLIQTYPVGDVVQTGYTALNFSESVTGNVANGCGDGMNDLLDSLNDLRGSSGDIYLGSLPAGILNTPGNSVGGCAPQGGKTAATFVDYPISPIGDVPHEIGHALDRHHAPCASGCSVSPADPDSDYPQYGSFRSDSIGVFGFDPTSNTVYPPSGYSDFMAYFFPQWVSAYTYNGLRGSSFQPLGGGSQPGLSPHFREDVDFDVIFLRLTIPRDRKVIREASFNYPAKLLNRKRCGQFTVEMQNKDRLPLICTSLHCSCDDGCNCWPKRIRDVVPFPMGSRWLVIWEGDTMIYEEEIPPEPKVKIKSAESKKDHVLLKWSAEHEGELWYLVHWYDERAGAWRGVAPRQKAQSLSIPANLFLESKELKVRILATPGLGTGITEQLIRIDDGILKPPQIIVPGFDTAKSKPFAIPDVLHAFIVDSAGRQLPDDALVWYGNDEVIGRGTQVDLRALGFGRHYVRLVMRGGQQLKARTWIVERTAEGFRLHHESCDPAMKRSGSIHKHPHPASNDNCND